MEHVLFNSLMLRYPKPGDEILEQVLKQSMVEQAQSNLNRAIDETFSLFHTAVAKEMRKLERMAEEVDELKDYIELKALESCIDDLESQTQGEEFDTQNELGTQLEEEDTGAN